MPSYTRLLQLHPTCLVFPGAVAGWTVSTRAGRLYVNDQRQMNAVNVSASRLGDATMSIAARVRMTVGDRVYSKVSDYGSMTYCDKYDVVVGVFSRNNIAFFHAYALHVIEACPAHATPINCLTWVSNKDLLISADVEGLIKVWRVRRSIHHETMTTYFTLDPVTTWRHGEGKPISTMFVAEAEHRLFVGVGQTILIYDLARIELAFQLDNLHSGTITSIDFSSRHGYLFTASVDCTIKIWALHHECVSLCDTLSEHTGFVNCIVYDVSNDMLYSCGQDGLVLSWNVEYGELLDSIQLASAQTAVGSSASSSMRAASNTVPRDLVLCQAAGAAASTLATRCRVLVVVSSTGMYCCSIYDLNERFVSTVDHVIQVQYAGDRLCVLARDNTATLFDPHNGTVLGIIAPALASSSALDTTGRRGSSSTGTSASALPALDDALGRRRGSSARRGVRNSDLVLDIGNAADHPAPLAPPASCLALLDPGVRLPSTTTCRFFKASNARTLLVFGWSTGRVDVRQVDLASGSTQPLTTLTTRTGGGSGAGASNSGNAGAVTAVEMMPLLQGASRHHACQASRPGASCRTVLDYLLLGHADGVLSVFCVECPVRVRSFRAHSHAIVQVQRVPETRMLFTVCYDGSVKLWLHDSLALVGVARGHDSGLTCFLLLQQGAVFMTGFADGVIEVWSVSPPQLGSASWTLCKDLQIHAHGDTITSLVMAKDTSVVASASLDNTVKVYDMARQVLLRTFSLGFPISHLAFLADSAVDLMVASKEEIHILRSHIQDPSGDPDRDIAPVAMHRLRALEVSFASTDDPVSEAAGAAVVAEQDTFESLGIPARLRHQKISGAAGRNGSRVSLLARQNKSLASMKSVQLLPRLDASNLPAIIEPSAASPRQVLSARLPLPALATSRTNLSATATILSARSSRSLVTAATDGEHKAVPTSPVSSASSVSASSSSSSSNEEDILAAPRGLVQYRSMQMLATMKQRESSSLARALAPSRSLSVLPRTQITSTRSAGRLTSLLARDTDGGSSDDGDSSGVSGLENSDEDSDDDGDSETCSISHSNSEDARDSDASEEEQHDETVRHPFESDGAALAGQRMGSAHRRWMAKVNEALEQERLRDPISTSDLFGLLRRPGPSAAKHSVSVLRLPKPQKEDQEELQIKDKQDEESLMLLSARARLQREESDALSTSDWSIVQDVRHSLLRLTAPEDAKLIEQHDEFVAKSITDAAAAADAAAADAATDGDKPEAASRPRKKVRRGRRRRGKQAAETGSGIGGRGADGVADGDQDAMMPEVRKPPRLANASSKTKPCIPKEVSRTQLPTLRNVPPPPVTPVAASPAPADLAGSVVAAAPPTAPVLLDNVDASQHVGRVGVQAMRPLTSESPAQRDSSTRRCRRRGRRRRRRRLGNTHSDAAEEEDDDAIQGVDGVAAARSSKQPRRRQQPPVLNVQPAIEDGDVALSVRSEIPMRSLSLSPVRQSSNVDVPLRRAFSARTPRRCSSLSSLWQGMLSPSPRSVARSDQKTSTMSQSSSSSSSATFHRHATSASSLFVGGSSAQLDHRFGPESRRDSLNSAASAFLGSPETLSVLSRSNSSQKRLMERLQRQQDLAMSSSRRLSLGALIMQRRNSSSMQRPRMRSLLSTQPSRSSVLNTAGAEDGASIGRVSTGTSRRSSMFSEAKPPHLLPGLASGIAPPTIGVVSPSVTTSAASLLENTRLNNIAGRRGSIDRPSLLRYASTKSVGKPSRFSGLATSSTRSLPTSQAASASPTGSRESFATESDSVLLGRRFSTPSLPSSTGTAAMHSSGAIDAAAAVASGELQPAMTLQVPSRSLRSIPQRRSSSLKSDPSASMLLLRSRRGSAQGPLLGAVDDLAAGDMADAAAVRARRQSTPSVASSIAASSSEAATTADSSLASEAFGTAASSYRDTTSSAGQSLSERLSSTLASEAAASEGGADSARGTHRTAGEPSTRGSARNPLCDDAADEPQPGTSSRGSVGVASDVPSDDDVTADSESSTTTQDSEGEEGFFFPDSSQLAKPVVTIRPSIVPALPIGKPKKTKKKRAAAVVESGDEESDGDGGSREESNSDGEDSSDGSYDSESDSDSDGSEEETDEEEFEEDEDEDLSSADENYWMHQAAPFAAAERWDRVYGKTEEEKQLEAQVRRMQAREKRRRERERRRLERERERMQRRRDRELRREARQRQGYSASPHAGALPARSTRGGVPMPRSARLRANSHHGSRHGSAAASAATSPRARTALLQLDHDYAQEQSAGFSATSPRAAERYRRGITRARSFLDVFAAGSSDDEDADADDDDARRARGSDELLVAPGLERRGSMPMLGPYHVARDDMRALNGSTTSRVRRSSDLSQGLVRRGSLTSRIFRGATGVLVNDASIGAIQEFTFAVDDPQLMPLGQAGVPDSYDTYVASNPGFRGGRVERSERFRNPYGEMGADQLMAAVIEARSRVEDERLLVEMRNRGLDPDSELHLKRMLALTGNTFASVLLRRLQAKRKGRRGVRFNAMMEARMRGDGHYRVDPRAPLLRRCRSAPPPFRSDGSQHYEPMARRWKLGDTRQVKDAAPRIPSLMPSVVIDYGTGIGAWGRRQSTQAGQFKLAWWHAADTASADDGRGGIGGAGNCVSDGDNSAGGGNQSRGDDHDCNSEAEDATAAPGHDVGVFLHQATVCALGNLPSFSMEAERMHGSEKPVSLRRNSLADFRSCVRKVRRKTKRRRGGSNKQETPSVVVAPAAPATETAAPASHRSGASTNRDRLRVAARSMAVVGDISQVGIMGESLLRSNVPAPTPTPGAQMPPTLARESSQRSLATMRSMKSFSMLRKAESVRSLAAAASTSALKKSISGMIPTGMARGATPRMSSRQHSSDSSSGASSDSEGTHRSSSMNSMVSRNSSGCTVGASAGTTARSTERSGRSRHSPWTDVSGAGAGGSGGSSAAGAAAAATAKPSGFRGHRPTHSASRSRRTTATPQTPTGKEAAVPRSILRRSSPPRRHKRDLQETEESPRPVIRRRPRNETFRGKSPRLSQRSTSPGGMRRDSAVSSGQSGSDTDGSSKQGSAGPGSHRSLASVRSGSTAGSFARGGSFTHRSGHSRTQ